MRQLALCVLVACAAPNGGSPRFANKPIVWRVDDRVDVPTMPRVQPFPQKVYFFDAYVYDPLTHKLDVPAPRHAMDVNAIDEVPDSSWFENRIGRRDLTLDEVRRGPNTVPVDAKKFTVIQSKTVGGSAGFIAIDGHGDRYVIKFDEPHAPVTESATDVAVQRLMWAIGYHVPENSVIYLTRDQVELSPKAVVKDEFGNTRPMTKGDVDAMFGRGYRKADRTYRMLASKYLSGKPLGGWPQRGTRRGDPNDKIPHEHRRVVRALYLFYAWLQQTDVKEDNTLDMYTEDKPTKRHYVKHHVLDFGKSLGMSAWIVPRPGDGHQENIDYEFLLRGIFSFGLWVRPYEGTLTPGIQGVGTFDAEHFDPGDWRPHANYKPLRFLDDRDLFWAAKIIARFSPAQIRAAIEQGRYEDPRAVDYLVDVLVARQKLAVRWALTRSVAPLDRFELTSDGLCFEDLLVGYQLFPGVRATTTFAATASNHSNRLLTWSAAGTWRNESGRACVPVPPQGNEREGYTIVRIATRRANRRLGDTEIHLANDPATGKPRIIGLHRATRSPIGFLRE